MSYFPPLASAASPPAPQQPIPAPIPTPPRSPAKVLASPGPTPLPTNLAHSLTLTSPRRAASSSMKHSPRRKVALISPLREASRKAKTRSQPPQVSRKQQPQQQHSSSDLAEENASLRAQVQALSVELDLHKRVLERTRVRDKEIDQNAEAELAERQEAERRYRRDHRALVELEGKYERAVQALERCQARVEAEALELEAEKRRSSTLEAQVSSAQRKLQRGLMAVLARRMKQRTVACNTATKWTPTTVTVHGNGDEDDEPSGDEEPPNLAVDYQGTSVRVPSGFVPLLRGSTLVHNQHRVQRLPLEELRAKLEHILWAKYAGDLKRPLMQRVPLPVHVYKMFLREHGQRTTAEMALLDLLASVEHFEQVCPRVFMFAELCGKWPGQDNIAGVSLGPQHMELVDESSELDAEPQFEPGEALPAQGFTKVVPRDMVVEQRLIEFYLRMVYSLRVLCVGPGRDVGDGGDGVCWLDSKSLARAVRTLLREFPEKSVSLILRRIVRLATCVQGAGQTHSSFVSLDAIMVEIMRAYVVEDIRLNYKLQQFLVDASQRSEHNEWLAACAGRAVYLNERSVYASRHALEDQRVTLWVVQQAAAEFGSWSDEHVVSVFGDVALRANRREPELSDAVVVLRRHGLLPVEVAWVEDEEAVEPGKDQGVLMAPEAAVMLKLDVAREQYTALEEKWKDKFVRAMEQSKKHMFHLRRLLTERGMDMKDAQLEWSPEDDLRMTGEERLRFQLDEMRALHEDEVRELQQTSALEIRKLQEQLEAEIRKRRVGAEQLRLQADESVESVEHMRAELRELTEQCEAEVQARLKLARQQAVLSKEVRRRRAEGERLRMQAEDVRARAIRNQQ